MLLRLSRAVCLLLGLITGGCFYVSDYIPPKDGRARVLWRDNRIVPHVSGAVPVSQDCASAVASLSQSKEIQFYGQRRFPDENKEVYYKDLLAAARSDFFNPWLVIHIPHHERYWRPRFFYHKFVLDMEDLEFGPRPVFDRSLAFDAERGKPGAEHDAPYYWNLLFQIETARALGLFSSIHVSFNDQARSYWAHLLLNIGMTALTPFLGVTALYPGVLSPLAAVESNYASNVVNAYNDLARLPDTPCSYSYKPTSDTKSDRKQERP